LLGNGNLLNLMISIKSHSKLKLKFDEKWKIEENLLKITEILSKFQNYKLPIQMRYVNKKMTIIEDLLQNNEDSYKNSNSLQQIADLLELGNILPYVIDYSLSQENYDFAIMKVKEMMEEKEEISFSLCEKLIQNDQISLNQKIDIVKLVLFIFRHPPD
jgi:hypothetical protein